MLPREFNLKIQRMIAEDISLTINEWIKKYSDTFYNFFLKRVKDKPAAKDILQEPFIAAWKSADSFKKEAGEKTWLFSILKNKLVDYYRLKARSKTDLADNHCFLMKLITGRKRLRQKIGSMDLPHLIKKNFILFWIIAKTS